MEEIWKDIKGYEGLYQISTYARVRSLGNGKSLNPIKNKAQILKGWINDAGYHIVDLHKDGKRRHLRVHRLYAIAFIDNPNNLPEVNHKDGNKLNITINNLEWTTKVGNVIHAWENGLANTRGEKNGRSKLTQLQINEIREKHKTGLYTNTLLGKMFGVEQPTISMIVNLKSWR